MEKVKGWILSLFSLLTCQIGSADPKDEEESGDEEDEGVYDLESGDDDESEEGDEEEIESDDVDGDDGKEAGKERSKFIPRERFDKVNAKAKQVERLLELGILSEDDEGELHVNPKALSKKEKASEEDSGEGEEDNNFYFSKEEVDETSWPLVQKINKGFKHYEGLANRMAYTVIQLQSENAILRDYPEFLQKESPLRKRALDIMKNDPEFKKTYKGNPERGYWAVKRAAELLQGKPSAVPAKKKVKSKFIIGKGDKGGSVKKPLDFSKMSREELDNLEKAEHKRLLSLGTGKK